MNFKKSALMLSFAAAMSLLNTTVFAVDMSKSEIIKATGKVAVKKTTSPEFKKLNTNLKLSGSLKNLDGGDKVRTYNDSTADLALKDTCILMVKEQSIFEVPKILNQKDLKTLTAQQGSVLFKVAKGNNFQVQTADVICGVKGTMFDVTTLNKYRIAVETTGLDIGYLGTGFTQVKVYEGEVEVTDKKENKKYNLKSGEQFCSAIFDGKRLYKNATKAVFNPQSAARDEWNNDVSLLMESKTIKDITNTYDKIEQKTGKLLGTGRSNYKSRIYYDNETVRKINNIDTKGIFGDNKYNLTQRDLNNAKTGFGLDKKDFNVAEHLNNFPKFESVKTFSNSFEEVYVGNNTFIACKAANGSNLIDTQAIEYPVGVNGISLKGTGWVKINTFDNNLRTSKELLVNFSQEGNKYITAINNTANNLYYRGINDEEPKIVPTGYVRYVYNMDTNKGSWEKVNSSIIPDELVNYKFNSLNKVYLEKQQFDKQQDAKQKEAQKQIINKARNNNEVQKKEQKLKNQLKNKIKLKW